MGQVTPDYVAGISSRSDHACKRGEVESWHCFNELRWTNQFAWLVFREEGIYCSASNRIVRNRVGMFVSQPYTGTRPDTLASYADFLSRQQCEGDFRDLHVISPWK